MKELLTFTAVFEMLTGLLLFAYPPILIRLLFDSDITGAGVMVSRVAGCSLIALGVACWPDLDMRRPFFGMLTYGVIVALYLAYVGLNGKAGILLWPVVAVHAALSILLVRAWRKEHRPVTG